MDAYTEAAFNKAKSDGITANQVSAMGYTEIAGLAGVQLGPNGESTGDFFYRNVRAAVVSMLNEYEEGLERAEILADLEAAKRTYPRLSKFSVYEEEDGFSLR